MLPGQVAISVLRLIPVYYQKVATLPKGVVAVWHITCSTDTYGNYRKQWDAIMMRFFATRKDSDRSILITSILALVFAVNAASAAEGTEAQADRVLREMSEYLRMAGEFTFHADITYDSVLARREN